MNLIELSNNLKDVPDHYLMNEVRQPTGAYPAYLVISELTRRKGMRDRALKNDPKSTVVEDLTQPNREQMMSAVAQMQQPAPQQQPLPPQMPPQMPLPPQMPPSGLMATPQASSLAATDAVASPRKHMAGGGLVAFNEGGDVKRLAEGDLIVDYDTPSPFSALFGSKDEAIARQAMENKRRAARAKALAQGELPVAETVSTKSGTTIPTSINTPVADIPAKLDPVAKAAQADIPLPPPYSLPASRGGAGTDYMKIFQGIKAPSAPTAAEEAAIAKSGEERYATAVPNRLESVEKELGSRTQNLKDRRKSALNEALMMAGIGVLKSKSPGRYFGEGAEEGMLAYRQSMKDVRGGEDLMTQARQDLAKAQILQDQGKFEAGQKMLERGIQKEQIANQKFQTESQNLSYGANANIHARANEISAEQLALQKALGPAQYYSLIASGQRSLTAADLNDARAAAQGAGAPQFLVAQLKANMGNPALIKIAQSKLMQSGISTTDPTYDQQLAAVYQQLAGIPGASAVAPPPINRNPGQALGQTQ